MTSLRDQLEALIREAIHLREAVAADPEPIVVRGMEHDADDFCRLATDIRADVRRVFEE